MNPKALTIGGTPANSRHAYLQNDLTVEALRRAEQDLRNAKRLEAWAAIAPRRSPVRDLFLRFISGCAEEKSGEERDYKTAEVVLHPAFFRRHWRPQHGNDGFIRSPRRRRQYMHTRLPEPPEAA